MRQPPNDRPTPEDLETVRKFAVLLVAVAVYAGATPGGKTEDGQKHDAANAIDAAETFVEVAEAQGYGPAAIVGAMG